MVSISHEEEEEPTEEAYAVIMRIRHIRMMAGIPDLLAEQETHDD